ncbi:MAG: TIR domain-containing protein [Promethearchaeota archaeon]
MENYIFICYSQKDHEIVDDIIVKLRRRGINVWIDSASLTPGTSWLDKITEAIVNASGVLCFISRNSLSSRYTMDEMSFAIRRNNLIMVVLDDSHLPAHLEFKLDDYPCFYYKKTSDLDQLASNISKAVQDIFNRELEQPLEKLDKEEVELIASSDVEEKRKRVEQVTDPDKPPESIFIVHGHDIDFLAEVENYIDNLGVKPLVLTKISNPEKSLFQKFLTWSRDVRYAVILISADDLGASRTQYEHPDVGDRALQFRARQNVILELGFFYGYLGWENVFVLFKDPDKVFPNFERPSDLSGVLFDRVDTEGNWKKSLRERLLTANFKV